MTTFMIAGFIGYSVACMAVAVAGQKRRIGGVESFFISFLLTPAAGFVFVMKSEKLIKEPEHKKYLCRHCGFMFDEPFEYCDVCEKNLLGEKQKKEEKVKEYDLSAN